MSTGIFFLIQSMFYIMLLSFVYFSKKRYKTYENKIYIGLIIINMIEVLNEIILYIIGPYNKLFPFLSRIIAKLYLVLVLLWITGLILYLIIISFKIKKKNFNLKLIIISFVIEIIILIIIISVLPIEYYVKDSIIYTYGASVKFIYSLCFLYTIIGIIILILNIKNIADNRYIPLLVLVVLGGTSAIIQMIYPGLLLATSVHVFITFLMYFTIENPDMEMLNKLTLAYNQAEESNNIKSDFLSSMSHEINTPLNAIMGFSQIMNDAKTLKEAKENSKYVLDASFTLHNMLKNAIDLMGIGNNNLSIEFEKYDLKSEINKLVSLYKKRVEDKNLRLNVKIEVPKMLYGDKKKVRRIIANLLDNAIKYTDEGSIYLTINSKIENSKCELEIIVKDTGTGIDEETQKHLFEYFEREKKYVNGNKSGMGLGLPIVKGLVELLDGKIECNSNEKGTTFNIKIIQRKG